MDPRQHIQLGNRRFAKAKIVGAYFSVGSGGVVRAHEPCVVDVTRQAFYLNGVGPGFDFSALDTYDAERGLLYREHERGAEGVLCFGMVGPRETPQQALQRRLPADPPDAAGLWLANRRAAQAAFTAQRAALGGAVSDAMRDLGVASVRFS